MRRGLRIGNGINLGWIDLVPRRGGSTPSTYSISGTVYDSDGSTPIVSAIVAIGANNTTSAANGTYTISGLASGTSGSLTCTKSGYLWTPITVAAMSGNLTAQDFRNAWWAATGIAAGAVAAYQPIGAASQAASYINLVNPGTNNAAPGTAPTWSAANGWVFVKESLQYLTTGIIVSTGWSAVCRFSDFIVSNDPYLFGAYNTAGTVIMGITPDSAGVGNKFVYWNGKANGTGAATATSGVVGVAAGQGYLNGSTDGSSFANAFAPSVALYIGGLNNDGSLFAPITAYIKAFAIYNTDIATAMSALSAAMAALP